MSALKKHRYHHDPTPDETRSKQLRLMQEYRDDPDKYFIFKHFIENPDKFLEISLGTKAYRGASQINKFGDYSLAPTDDEYALLKVDFVPEEGWHITRCTGSIKSLFTIYSSGTQCKPSLKLSADTDPAKIFLALQEWVYAADAISHSGERRGLRSNDFLKEKIGFKVMPDKNLDDMFKYLVGREKFLVTPTATASRKVEEEEEDSAPSENKRKKTLINDIFNQHADNPENFNSLRIVTRGYKGGAAADYAGKIKLPGFPPDSEDKYTALEVVYDPAHKGWTLNVLLGDETSLDPDNCIKAGSMNITTYVDEKNKQHKAHAASVFEYLRNWTAVAKRQAEIRYPKAPVLNFENVKDALIIKHNKLLEKMAHYINRQEIKKNNSDEIIPGMP
jgi:hypothetical protein